MKLKIKHLTVFLPPGSIAVIEDTARGIVMKGIIDDLHFDSALEARFTSVTGTRGKIDYQGTNYLDPAKCALSDSGNWLPVDDFQISIEAKILGVAQYGGGIFRAQSTQAQLSIIFFPKR